MNKFSFPVQVPAVHRSIALLGLAVSVGTTGTLIHEPKDDLQAQTVPTKLSSTPDREQLLLHQIQPGETLWHLSKTYNLDAAVIAAANNISAVTSLAPGQKLLIPPTEGVIHHPQPGETIAEIAEFYDVRVEDIAKFAPEINPQQLDSTIVVPGDIETLLSIRVEDAKNRLTEEKEQLEQQIAALEKQPEIYSKNYKVQPGDTIEDLAIEFKVSKTEIIARNQLQNPDLLALGQELEIPGMQPVASSKVDLPKFIPTISQEIAQGDKGNLIELAAHFGILPSGGEAPLGSETQAPIQEEKIAALPAKEAPLPIVSETQAPIQEEKIAALPAKEAPLPIVSETQTPIQEEKIAAVPPETTQVNPVEPTRVAALTTIEIVRQPAIPSLIDTYKTVKTPQLPPIPPASKTIEVNRIPQKLAARNLSPAEQPPALKPVEEARMTAPEVKTLQQQVEQLRAELNSKQIQKVAAINPSARSGFIPEPIEFGRLEPELPRLNAANFLPDPSNYGLSDEFVWPASGIMTSGFGWRWGRLHQGIDIAAPVGTPIWAAASGVVQFAGWNDGGYGYMIDILHGNGTVTRYAHMSALYVKSGQNVQQAQVIGAMGSTGYSTGPHLHFEVRPSGGVAVNPMTYLAKAGRSRSAG